jgi:hypothetical protein
MIADGSVGFPPHLSLCTVVCDDLDKVRRGRCSALQVCNADVGWSARSRWNVQRVALSDDSSNDCSAPVSMKYERLPP